MKNAVAAAVSLIALVGYSADLTYNKENATPHPTLGIYQWDDAAAWGGALPTAADDAAVYGNFTEEAPFQVQYPAVARTFDVGSKTLSQNGDVLNMVVNDDLTVSTDVSVWGYKATTNNILISSGGTLYMATNRLGHSGGPTVNVVNRGTANYAFLMIGQYKGSNCRYDNYGDLNIRYSLYMGRGTGSVSGEQDPGESILYLHEGSTFERLSVASEGSGYSFDYIGVEGKATIISEVNMVLPNSDNMRLGTNRGGSGTLILQGNAIYNPSILESGMALGYDADSTGNLVLKDNAQLYLKKSTDQFNVASASNSTATITMSGSSLLQLKNSGGSIGAGQDSSTTINLSGDAQMNLTAGTPFASGKNASVAFNLADNAFMTTTDYSIGGDGATISGELVGTNCYIKATQKFSYLATDPTGSGEIVLKGGYLYLRPHKSSEYNSLSIGGAGADAVLRGWSAITPENYVPSDSQARRIYTTMRGRIIADGFGEDHDLDCSYLTLSNQTDVACANAGWYAQNHGCLIMPHGDKMTNSTIMVGDNSWRGGDPTVVNSMRVTLAGSNDGFYLHANLYAPDHTAVPAGLPSTGFDEVLSVWNMGYNAAGRFSKSGGTNDGKNFTSATVKLRHQTSFGRANKSRYQIVGYRYDGTGWVKLSEQDFSESSPFYTFTNLPKVTGTGTGYNMGWIALVAHYNATGSVLIFK